MKLFLVLIFLSPFTHALEIDLGAPQDYSDEYINKHFKKTIEAQCKNFKHTAKPGSHNIGNLDKKIYCEKIRTLTKS